MPSRNMFSIWKSIELKDWKTLRVIFDAFIHPFNKNKAWIRNYTWLDSFRTPIYRQFLCRFIGHKWSTKEDGIKYELDNCHICWKCLKKVTNIEYQSLKRDNIINKILK